MKKILCLILAFVMLFTFACCGSSEADSLISENWLEYLKFNEKVYSAIVWGTGYIDKFCKNPDITSYRRALAACETVGATLRVLEIPEFTLTQQDIDEKMKKGIDVSFLTIEFSAIKTDTENTSAFWESLSREMLLEGFWEYGIEYLDKTAEYQLKQVQLKAEYLCHTTNYLQLLLGEKSYDSTYTRSCPTIFAFDKGFAGSLAEAKQNVTVCLDELDGLIGTNANLTSLQKANYTVFENAVRTGDYSELYSLALPWGKGCFPIPVPSFDSLPLIYSYKTNNGDITWTSVGDELTDVPPGLLLEYEDVTKQQLGQYAALLESVGLAATEITGNYEDENVFEYLYADGTNEFALKWEEGTARIYITQKTAYFCHLWYLNYLVS